jgi:hypothetical protein
MMGLGPIRFPFNVCLARGSASTRRAERAAETPCRACPSSCPTSPPTSAKYGSTSPKAEYPSIRRRWRYWAGRCRRAAAGQCEMPGERRAKRATGLIYAAMPGVMTGRCSGSRAGY